MKILVLGLGNPILGDDGVGWCVADEVRPRVKTVPDVEVDCVALGGLSLMERLTDCEQAILVDAMFTGKNEIGTVSLLNLDDLPDLSSGHTTAAHDTSLRNALQVGRSMHVRLPQDKDVHIVAIEAANVYDFSEELSLEVKKAVPRAVSTVLQLIHQLGGKNDIP
jgi:hydrogenase maturation protease